MGDIVEFLRARLDEDEAVAGSATTGPWSNNDPMARDGVHAEAIDGYVADCNYDRMGPFAVHNATHIARHDPPRILREVAAKRTIVDLHHGDWPYDPAAGPGNYSWTERCQGCHEAVPCQTLKILAAIWEEHPNFDASWTVADG